MSKGSADKSLIEFKLASNTSPERNLQNKVEIYEGANGTRHSVKVIVATPSRAKTRWLVS